MGVKTLIRMAVLGVAFSVPAAAQGLAPCARSFPSADQFFGALEAEGWGAPKADVSDQLAWINAVAYLGGDMGGATLTDVLSSQRKAAANYARLKPLATSETRILTAGDAVMLASWQRPVPTVATVQCRGALTEAPTQRQTFDGPFGTHEQVRLAGGIPGVSEYRFHYNRDAIRSELPGATPPAVVFNITYNYQIEVSE